MRSTHYTFQEPTWMSSNCSVCLKTLKVFNHQVKKPLIVTLDSAISLLKIS